MKKEGHLVGNQKKSNTRRDGKKQNRIHKVILFLDQQDGFEEHLAVHNQSKMTIRTYLAGARQFLGWLTRKGIYDLREVSKEIIRGYQLYIKNYRDENGQNYTLNTVSIKLRAVKRFFDYLEATRHILYNPAVVIKDIKLGCRLPKNILSHDEVRLIMRQPNTSTLTGMRDRMIFELLYSTGIRLEELSQLTVYDADYKTGFLRVTKGKFAKDRVLPLGKASCRYLQEYINRVRPRLTERHREERSLLVGQTGNRLKAATIGLMTRKYARQAGVKKRVSTHTWRHTFASHLLAGGADVLHVQRLLGHSQPAVTMKYTRVTPVDIKTAQNKTHPRERDREGVIQIKKGMRCQGEYRQRNRTK